jgi:hypothetical protein
LPVDQVLISHGAVTKDLEERLQELLLVPVET